mmetsp:Transcript_29385/g.94344  ORF Transcript_29385/g.94344 Transcript_29385/m.94344 type:complete len:223 (+) Transcript_29385:3871-4539(+)
MWDFCRMMPTVGALATSMPAFGACTLSYHSKYSSDEAKTPSAMGCQMPLSGMRSGSAMSSAATILSSSITNSFARLRIMLSMFSGEPPSQYWKDIMKVRASFALSDGRYLSTLGSVRRSLSMPSSKELWLSLRFFFMKSAMTDLDWPRLFMVNEPTLFRRITSGMDGNTSTASRLSRSAPTTSMTLSASSCTKMREPMKTLASTTSLRNFSMASSERSSSRR